MEYANRHDNFTELKQAISEQDIVFLMAGPAFGITSFLNEHISRSTSKCFYANAGANRSVAAELLNGIISSDSKKELQKLADEKLGDRNINVIEALLGSVPYVGSTAAHFAKKKSAAPVYTGNYTYALAELLVPLFEDITKQQPIEVIIDTAQDTDETSYSVVAALCAIPKVTTIMAITEENDRYLKVKNHLAIYSKLRMTTLLFGEPDPHLISELAKSYGFSLSDVEIQQVLQATQKNIHRIIEAVSNYTATDAMLSALQNAIVHLLSICSDGLSQEEICSMILQSNVFTTDVATDVGDALCKLYNQNIAITKYSLLGSKTYVLVGNHHPLVESCLDVYSDNLYFRNLVYEFYEQKGIDGSVEKTELMYSLSRELAQGTRKKYAAELLKYKLKMGEVISEDILLAAELSKKNNHDISLATLYYCRERRYRDALEWLESIRNKKNITYYSNLRAVLLNRVRRMDEAEPAFVECISNERDPSKLNILYAYSLANTLHLHGAEPVKEKYLKAYEKLSGTTNSGYFARNFASAVPADEKEVFYKAAIRYFTENRDDFGLYSTHCDWGNALCSCGRPRDAYGHLLEAEQGLQQFGAAHLHIVYNDIGMCHFMNREYGDAEKYLSLSNRLGMNTMPTVMVAINRACLALAKDDIASAGVIMEEAWDHVQEHKVGSLKTKYYTNLLLVKYAAGQEALKTFLEKHSSKITEYVDPSLLDKYMGFLSEGREYSINDVHDLYCPSGLAYWYIDPLKLV